jgi:hypothetical protein
MCGLCCAVYALLSAGVPQRQHPGPASAAQKVCAFYAFYEVRGLSEAWPLLSLNALVHCICLDAAWQHPGAAQAAQEFRAPNEVLTRYCCVSRC